MALTQVNNGDSGLTVRTTINDNFSDLDTRTSAIEENSAKDYVDYTPQATPPAMVEGRTYYDQDRGVLVAVGSEGRTVELGRMMHLYVRNESGATLEKGRPVKFVGLGANDEILVAYAQADTLANARVLGLVQVDIPNNSNGAIVTSGELEGVDLTASGLNVPAGVPLYLSADVAGEITTTPPDLVTRLGGSPRSTTDGAIIVLIENLVTLPTLGAYFQQLNDSTPINSTTRIFGNPTTFPQGFSDSESLLVDISSGYSFVVPANGVYGGSFVVSMSNIDAHNNGHVIAIGIAVNGVNQFTYNMIVGRNDTVASCSFSASVSLAENDEVTMTYRELSNNNVDGNGNIVIDGIQLKIISEQIR